MTAHDFRAAWRRLLARRSYSLLAFVVLGTGLGTVLFVLGLINGLVLDPLPFPDAHRLMALGYEREHDIGVGDMNLADVQRLQPELRSFQALGVYAEGNIALQHGEQARRYDATLLSADALALLGAKPLFGRGFAVADDRPGAALGVLLSESVWRNQFGADPGVLGKSLRVDGEAASVIGVMPDGFAFPYVSHVWLPLRAALGDETSVGVVARLADGRSATDARAEIEAVVERLGTQLASERKQRDLTLKPLAYRFVDETTRAYLWLMFAAATVVLLLACANVSNLQLTQALKRRRELAVRSALGAGRWQLLREQLAESLLLSAFATVVALLIGQLSGHWLVRVFAENEQAPPYFVSLGPDLRLLGFSLLAALATTALAGLLPALRASRPDLNDALRDGAKGSTGSGFARVAVGLVVAEVALTVVLLVSAGTFLRGLQRILDMDLGTRADPQRMLTARIALPSPLADDAGARARYYDTLGLRLRSDAEITAASLTTTLPGAQLGSHEFIGAAGGERPADGWWHAQFGVVDDAFATTFGLSLSAGRFFDARDTIDAPAVAVIDRALADALWPGRDPLGLPLLVNPDAAQPDEYTVVGVVDRLHLEGPLDPPLPSFLGALRQAPPRDATIALTPRGEALAFAPRLAALVHAVDPTVPLWQARTQARAIDIQRLSAVVLTQVFTIVGAIALLLATAGLYGVLAFAVEQRTREIGVRRALGARTSAIVSRVTRRLAWQVGGGLVVGLAISLPWSALIADPALHTRSYDAPVFVLVLAVVLAVGVLAAAIPLRRALRVDPAIALRHE